MGTICSNGTELSDETETDLDLTPSDKTYQFVFKKEGSNLNEKNSKFYTKNESFDNVKRSIERKQTSIRYNQKEYSNVDVEEEGMAMFINYKREESGDNNYFDNRLPDNYNTNRKLGAGVIKMRNVLIVLTIFEIFTSMWGFSYFFVRRSLIIIFVNCFAFVVAILGVFSSIFLNEIGLILYALLTTSLPGTFFFYQILELLIPSSNASSQASEGKLNDNALMIIFSLPYLFDLICGIYAMMMMSKMAKFNKIILERRNNEEASKRLYSNEDLEKIKEKYNSEAVAKIYSERISKNLLGECVVCMENTREIILKPCNDILLCVQCYEKLKSNSFMSSIACPKCRKTITGFEKCYT